MAWQKLILRPFWRSCAIGLAISTLMLTVYRIGMLQRLEGWALDLRFQYANRLLQPRDDIRIVAIDEQSLRQVKPLYGSYPWPRKILADMVGVLKEAGARHIALDLHYPESHPDDPGFAKAIRQAGNVYLPVVCDVMSGAYDMTRAQEIMRELVRDSAIPSEEQLSQRVGLPPLLLGQDAFLRSRMADRLRGQFWLNDEDLAAALKADVPAVREWIGKVRQEVAMELVSRHLQTHPDATAGTIRDALTWDANQQANVSLAELAWALEQTQAQQIVRGKLLALPRVNPTKLMQIHNPCVMQVPVAPLGGEATGFGHVVFLCDPGGAVRRLPMLVRWDGKVIPQLALRLASDILHLQWDQAEVTAEKITVPVPAQEGRDGYRLTMYLDEAGQTLVNWTRPGKQWDSAFAPVPAGVVLEVAELRRIIRQNEQWLQTRQLALVQLIQKEELGHYESLKDQEQQILRQLEGYAASSQPVEKRLQDQLQQIRTQEKLIETACIDMLNELAPDLSAAIEQETDPAEQAKMRLALALHKEIAQGDLIAKVQQGNARLAARLGGLLEQLRQRLAGRMVFVGCTAAGLGDTVSTPTWDEAPGVMTHAQMLNGLLENRPIRPIDTSANTVIVLLCCLAVTVVAAVLGPRLSLVTVVAVCIALIAVSSWVLFERMGLATALATPVLGMFVTWAMITAYRQLVEERAKRHITRTLQQYTSPALARRMAEDPTAVDKAEFREVTCFFSDLKGFTSISERIGAEATQQILNVYLDRMTEVLDRHEALINKFLGDGIFAFFNPAINPQPDHARKACLAALEAQEALARLKRDTGSSLHQALHMRIGLASGMAVVGNCGSERKFDYTCIGDTVNLASRLESTNKTFGTSILINGRCEQLIPEGFALRHIGRLLVVGRAACEETYELLGCRGDVDPQTLEDIECFEQSVRCFIAGNLERALAGFQECLKYKPDDTAARHYVTLCQAYLKGTMLENWTGTVELTGK